MRYGFREKCKNQILAHKISLNTLFHVTYMTRLFRENTKTFKFYWKWDFFENSKIAFSAKIPGGGAGLEIVLKLTQNKHVPFTNIFGSFVSCGIS